MKDREKIDELYAVLAKSSQERDAAMEKSSRERDAAMEKSRREFYEAMEKSNQELKARIKEVTLQLGGMGNSNGACAEEYFATAMEEVKVFAGQQFDDIGIDVKGRAGELKDQFDIVLYNGESVAIIEIKYKAQPTDLEHMVAKKVPNFRTLFPYYENYKIYLGLGSMSFNNYVYAKAKELGIGLLKQNGKIVEAEPGFVKAY